MTKLRCRVLLEEAKGVVHGALRANGACPAEEFLAALDLSARVKFRSLMSRLIQEGRINNTQRMRKLKVEGEPPVWELKTHAGRGYRLFLVQVSGEWIATHGDAKPKPRDLVVEVKRARSILKEARR